MTNIKTMFDCKDINVLEYYDPEDDVILPDTIWGELYYIYCNLEDIIFNRCNRKELINYVLLIWERLSLCPFCITRVLNHHVEFDFDRIIFLV